MATDAEIRAKGIKFLPLQKYLQNPYEFPVEEETPPVPGGITNTNAFTGSGGDNFSVYNPDPNSIVNREYRPNYDYRKSVDYDPSLSATANEKQFDMAQKYYNAPPPSRLEGLASQAINFSPFGFIKKGLDFFGDYIPPNRRKIMENELGGKGIMVNDIGQIVQGQGDYNTAGNVMAGYNAGQITQKTIDKRQGTIEKTLVDKYGMSPTDIAAVKAGTYKGPVETDLIGRYGALGEYGNINNLTNKKVDKMEEFEEEQKKKRISKNILSRIFKKKKAAKDTQGLVDVQAVKDNIKKADQKGKNSPDNYGVQGLQRSGSYGGNDTYSGSGSTVSSSGDVTDNSGNYSGNINDEFAEGGRAGYFFGGRVNYKKGGRINFRGGGADMGAPEKAAERTNRGYGTAPDTGSKSGTNDYSTPTQDRNHDRAMRDNQREKPSTLDNVMNLGSEVNYLKNLYKMDPIGLGIGFGVNKLRTYIKNKNFQEEDKLSYNTNPLPTNNYMTKVSKQDLAKYSQQKDLINKQDYPSAMDTTFFGSEITPYEFQEMKKGNITEPGTYIGADGGRVYLVNGGLAGLL